MKCTEKIDDLFCSYNQQIFNNNSMVDENNNNENGSVDLNNLLKTLSTTIL